MIRLSNYQWLLVVIMPFGPILLDLQGFYQSPIDKTKWKSFIQIVAGHGLSEHSGQRLRDFPASAPGESFGSFALYWSRPRSCWSRSESSSPRSDGRAIRGELRERILLAGVPQDIAALEDSFTPEQKLLMVIADRIDIEKQPLSDLVEAMHRHAVARVIFAAGHSQFNRIEQAIGACEVEGVPAWLVANFIQTSIAKPDFDAFAGRPMLVFRSTPEVSWALLIKGIIDRLGAFVALIVVCGADVDGGDRSSR